MNLKQRAVEAYNAEEKRIEEERLAKRWKTAAQAKNRLVELFGEDDYTVHDDGTVTVGDLILGMSYEFSKYTGILCLVGKCFVCKKNVNLGTVACAETLGRLIKHATEYRPMCEECHDEVTLVNISVQRNILYAP